ncbi:DUF2958 domain-containing protein [Brassicibacter mesophilus]|uniref:DUF2958 domain-containing protein n=1 Tax=Brassicibacter mesophilus TaxID=745119 RepID=UPI003D1D52AC
MKLLTQEIREALPKLYETEEIKLNQKVVIAKYFCGSFTWYVIEGEEREDGDFLFWGYVKNEADNFCSEFGYFTLSQLEELTLENRRKLPFIERDLHFQPRKLIELLGRKF